MVGSVGVATRSESHDMTLAVRCPCGLALAADECQVYRDATGDPKPERAELSSPATAVRSSRETGQRDAGGTRRPFEGTGGFVSCPPDLRWFDLS